MRLAFAGTPAFAERALDALLAAGHDVVLVLTRPDQPAGRGQRVAASPVKRLAERHGLPVFQPRTLRDEAAQQRLRETAPEVMVVAAYGLLLPPAVLAIPPRGCLNIHASLLPRWRGAAPIQRAIEAGDACTGITIMQMDAGLDTGPILLESALPIGAEESAASVQDRLAELGAQAIVEALRRLEAGTLAPRPQPGDGVTYAAKVGKAESAIDWRLAAREVADRIRAFDPAPGATAVLERLPDAPLKVWRARVAPAAAAAPPAAAPGTVVAIDVCAVTVACGDGGAVALLELQRPGGRRMTVAEFLRGFPLAVGDRMRLPAPPAGARGIGVA
jgi:methionyl-tRNA formyltransferase